MAVALTGGAGVLAQTAPHPAANAPVPAERMHDHASHQADGAEYHQPLSADIIVSAPYARDRRAVLSGVSIVSGAQLAEAVRPTIGETLTRIPGVSASSFGPNASRPILRGLAGERIRLLTDGIGSIDVSNTSADHAAAINPLLADRIEVVRGPASLAYGSAAIGGVVNVLDRRIPRAVPDEPVHADFMATYGSAANERSLASAIDVRAEDAIVVHVDGSITNTDDMRIGGRLLSSAARRTAVASAALPVREQIDAFGEHVDFAGLATARGRLKNSAAKTWTVGAGAAYVTDATNVGIAYSRFDSLYGVPVRYALAPGGVQEEGRIDLKQDRFDARADIHTGEGFLDAVLARAGYATYRHFELEADGRVGTAFHNKGFEGRVEFAQAQRGAWKGASGVQYLDRRLNVVGEEAFVPRNRTSQTGIFTLQEFDTGPLKIEAGARYEHSRHTAKPDAGQARFFAGQRNFDAFSGSAGLSYAPSQEWRIGVNLSRTERAPSAEELFANGPHHGSETYELGDPTFRKERSVGLEAILRGRGRGYSFEASAYHNWFDNFIYQDNVADAVCTAAAAPDAHDHDHDHEEQGDAHDHDHSHGHDYLPCYQFRQGKARYYGFEVQGSVTLAKVGGYTIAADGLADYVRATVRNVGPAPRIPPLRLLGGLSLAGELFDVRAEVERVARQDRTSPGETETGGYTMANVQIGLRPWGAQRISFILSANNIFDVSARRHASILKDFAPLAGRDIRVTARASF